MYLAREQRAASENGSPSQVSGSQSELSQDELSQMRLGEPAQPARSLQAEPSARTAHLMASEDTGTKQIREGDAGASHHFFFTQGTLGSMPPLSYMPDTDELNKLSADDDSTTSDTEADSEAEAGSSSQGDKPSQMEPHHSHHRDKTINDSSGVMDYANDDDDNDDDDDYVEVVNTILRDGRRKVRVKKEAVPSPTGSGTSGNMALQPTPAPGESSGLNQVQPTASNDQVFPRGVGVGFQAGRAKERCDVCFSDEVLEEGNIVIRCECCKAATHIACYGLPDVPPSPWVCNACSLRLGFAILRGESEVNLLSIPQQFLEMRATLVQRAVSDILASTKKQPADLEQHRFTLTLRATCGLSAALFDTHGHTGGLLGGFANALGPFVSPGDVFGLALLPREAIPPEWITADSPARVMPSPPRHLSSTSSVRVVTLANECLPILRSALTELANKVVVSTSNENHTDEHQQSTTSLRQPNEVFQLERIRRLNLSSHTFDVTLEQVWAPFLRHYQIPPQVEAALGLRSVRAGHAESKRPLRAGSKRKQSAGDESESEDDSEGGGVEDEEHFLACITTPDDLGTDSGLQTCASSSCRWLLPKHFARLRNPIPLPWIPALGLSDLLSKGTAVTVDNISLRAVCPVDCALCPSNADRIFKPTIDGRWVHVSCALWHQEVKLLDPDLRDVIDISSIARERCRLQCMFCRIKPAPMNVVNQFARLTLPELGNDLRPLAELIQDQQFLDDVLDDVVRHMSSFHSRSLGQTARMAPTPPSADTVLRCFRSSAALDVRENGQPWRGVAERSAKHVRQSSDSFDTSPLTAVRASLESRPAVRLEGSGACVQCTFGRCTKSYHVPCGYRYGASFELRELNDEVYFHNYCPNHADMAGFVITDQNHLYAGNHRRDSSARSPRSRPPSNSLGSSSAQHSSGSRNGLAPSESPSAPQAQARSTASGKARSRSSTSPVSAVSKRETKDRKERQPNRNERNNPNEVDLASNADPLSDAETDAASASGSDTDGDDTTRARNTLGKRGQSKMWTSYPFFTLKALDLPVSDFPPLSLADLPIIQDEETSHKPYSGKPVVVRRMGLTTTKLSTQQSLLVAMFCQAFSGMMVPAAVESKDIDVEGKSDSNHIKLVIESVDAYDPLMTTHLVTSALSPRAASFLGNQVVKRLIDAIVESNGRRWIREISSTNLATSSGGYITNDLKSLSKLVHALQTCSTKLNLDEISDSHERKALAPLRVTSASSAPLLSSVLTQRTMKYFQCLAGGQQVLCFDYIIACLLSRRLLDPGPFRVVGDVVCPLRPVIAPTVRRRVEISNISLPAPLRSSSSFSSLTGSLVRKTRLFSGLVAWILDSATFKPTEEEPASRMALDIELLLNLAGGVPMIMHMHNAASSVYAQAAIAAAAAAAPKSGSEDPSERTALSTSTDVVDLELTQDLGEENMAEEGQAVSSTLRRSASTAAVPVVVINIDGKLQNPLAVQSGPRFQQDSSRGTDSGYFAPVPTARFSKLPHWQQQIIREAASKGAVLAPLYVLDCLSKNILIPLKI